MICTILTSIIIVLKFIVVFLVCFIGVVGLLIFIDIPREERKQRTMAIRRNNHANP
jgi:hypothetical protein